MCFDIDKLLEEQEIKVKEMKEHTSVGDNLTPLNVSDVEEDNYIKEEEKTLKNVFRGSISDEFNNSELDNMLLLDKKYTELLKALKKNQKELKNLIKEKEQRNKQTTEEKIKVLKMLDRKKPDYKEITFKLLEVLGTATADNSLNDEVMRVRKRNKTRLADHLEEIQNKTEQQTFEI